MIRDPTQERLVASQKRSVFNMARMLRKIPTRVRFGGGGSGTATPTLPKPYDMTLGGGNITFVPGNINQLLPTGVLDPQPYTPGSSVYAVLHATSDGRQITGATIELTATPSIVMPTAQGTAPDAFDVLIGTVINDVVYQDWRGNIQATIIQTHVEEKLTPTPGVSPITRYFSWALTVV